MLGALGEAGLPILQVLLPAESFEAPVLDGLERPQREAYKAPLWGPLGAGRTTSPVDRIRSVYTMLGASLP